MMQEVLNILKKHGFNFEKYRSDIDGLSSTLKEKDVSKQLKITEKIYTDLKKEGWRDGVGDSDDESFQLVKTLKGLKCFVKILPGRKGLYVYAEEI